MIKAHPDVTSRDAGSTRRIPLSLVLKAAALALLLGGGFALVRFTPVGDYFHQERMVQLLGEVREKWWAPLALIGLYAVTSPLGMPVSVFILGGGVVFGALYGSLYNLTGLFAGAATTYGLGRFLGRDVVAHFVGDRLRRVEKILDRHGFWPLVQTRFLPIPYALVNYSAAMVGIDPARFFIATLVGLVPATVLHTYFIATLFEAQGHRTVVLAQYVAALALFNAAISWPSIREQLRRRRRYREVIAARREIFRARRNKISAKSPAKRSAKSPGRLAVATLLLATGLAAPGLVHAQGRPELMAVPRPDLEHVDLSLRQRLETAREQLDVLLVDTSRTTAELAAGFAEMGLYYDAASLVGPAESCLENAVRLAPKDFRYVYLLGAFAHRERRLGRSVELLERGLELRPGDVPTLLRLGDALFLSDRLDASKKRFEEALEKVPDLAYAHYGLGRLAAADQDWQAAKRHFEAALAAQPEADSIHQPLGLAYREIGEIERARAHLTMAGTRPVVFADPLIESFDLSEIVSDAWAAVQARRSGEIERAATLYRRLVENHPENTSYRQSLATTLFQLGRIDDAVVELDRVIQAEPSNAMAHFRIAQMLVQQEMGSEEEPTAATGDMSPELERAISHLRAAVELAPELQEAQLALARALARGGSHREALRPYARAVELDPQDLQAKRQWARSLAQIGDNALAAQKLREVVEADPSDARARLDLATTLSRLGSTDAAIGHFETALGLDLNPRQRMLALFSSAALHQQKGDDAKAIGLYQEVVEMAPGLRDARFNLGTALVRQNLLADAAKQFAAVVEMASRDVPARLAWVQVLGRRGDWKGAVRVLEQGLEVLPGAAVLESALARILANCPDLDVRDPARAVELARSAAERRPTLENRLGLAGALGAAKQWREAVEILRPVIEEARRGGAPAETLRSLEQQLGQYERSLAASGGSP